MTVEYRSIPIDQIDIPTGRQHLDRDWVEALAENIARHGQRAPIEVVISGNRFRLLTGRYRLAACRQAKIGGITAAVFPAEAFADAAQERLAEIAENVVRRKLSILERALYVADWRSIYEAAQGEVKRGKRNKSQFATYSHADPQMQAAELFAGSFSEASQRALGLKRDSVFRLLKIAGLDADTRDRVALTAIADNQADLLALAGLAVDMRGKVLDLIFSTTPPAVTSVADAIVLAEGRRLPSSAEKLLTSVMNNFSKLSDRDRRAVFAAHEDEIRAYAQEKGWL